MPIEPDPGPAPVHAYEWTVLRVVPRVERGEYVNAGVVVYSATADFLGARVHVDEDRWRTLDPGVDAAGVRAHLRAVAELCTGATAGRRPWPGDPAAAPRRTTGEWFRWLVAPRSTMLQTAPVHTGVSTDPAAEADRLLARYVLPRPPEQ